MITSVGASPRAPRTLGSVTFTPTTCPRSLALSTTSRSSSTTSNAETGRVSGPVTGGGALRPITTIVAIPASATAISASPMATSRNRDEPSDIHRA